MGYHIIPYHGLHLQSDETSEYMLTIQHQTLESAVLINAYLIV